MTADRYNAGIREGLDKAKRGLRVTLGRLSVDAERDGSVERFRAIEEATAEALRTIEVLELYQARHETGLAS